MSSVAPIPASRADTGVGHWDWTKPHPSASHGPTLLFSLSYPFSHLPFLHISRLPTPSFAPSSLYLPPVFPWISSYPLPTFFHLSLPLLFPVFSSSSSSFPPFSPHPLLRLFSFSFCPLFPVFILFLSLLLSSSLFCSPSPPL